MHSAICGIEHIIQAASGACALIAAINWLKASLLKFPATGTYANIDEVYGLLSRQSRLNAYAAGFAAVAAILQFPLAFMPSCWSGAPWFG